MYFKTIILGIVEGLTEFLPVSSTGHLILISEFLKFFKEDKEFVDLFNIVIQMGAIIAVLIYFRKTIFMEDLSFKSLKKFVLLWSKVLVSILPAGILGILYHKKINELLFNPKTVAISLIVGAIWILFIDSKFKPKFIKKYLKSQSKIKNVEELSFFKSFIIGIFQCLALIPGMSRSAMTIIGALLCHTNRKLAAEFSFYMSIPTLLGAGLIDLIKTDVTLSIMHIKILFLGTFVSFITAYFVIAVFMSFIKKHNFSIFAYYRILLGIAVLFLVK